MVHDSCNASATDGRPCGDFGTDEQRGCEPISGIKIDNEIPTGDTSRLCLTFAESYPVGLDGATMQVKAGGTCVTGAVPGPVCVAGCGCSARSKSGPLDRRNTL